MRSTSEKALPYSVLMSVYAKEQAEFLSGSLECILNQSAPPEQVVIVKDGSLTPELDDILCGFEKAHPDLFTFVGYEENRGLWYALVLGVRACRNELIMRMDSDDWCSPRRAERQLAEFERHPEYGCVGTLVAEFVDDPESPVALVDLPETDEEIRAYGRKRNPFRHPSLMYRKSAVLAAGSYQRMPYFEDYDLFMRLAATGCVFHNVQERLVCMRVSEDFYARRGGTAYLGDMLRFKTNCLRRGYMGLTDFAGSTIPHAIVCVLPNKLRELTYMKLLRGGGSSKC